jgi:hypothetical protein
MAIVISEVTKEVLEFDDVIPRRRLEFRVPVESSISGETRTLQL